MTLAARCGIATPGVSLAGVNGGWQIDQFTIEDLAAIGAAADRLGYAYLTCSEHVGIPPEVEAARGGRYYDPLPTFGYLSALTSRIRFLTYVLVLSYAHPLEIAKRYGTLDRISGGRLTLGVGVGSLKQEFDLLGLGGSEFEQRGPRGDDAIRAIRASMGRRMPEYHGPHYSFGDMIIDPCAVQQDMPVWVGGRTMRSLRRALTLGDGWIPFGLSLPDLAAMLARARDTEAWATRNQPFELALWHEGLLDPVGDPGRTAEQVGTVFAAGGTLVHAAFRSRSCAHYLEQLEALAELAV